MSVYFVQRADGGPIKIGCTAFLDARLSQLATIHKARIVLLASAPGSFREEGRLHRQFADYRVEREWFEDCAPIRAAIRHVQEKGVLPPPQAEDREIVMAARYLSGETLQAIGSDFGVTRERVRQILRRSDIPSLGWRAGTMRQAAPITDAEQEIAAAYAQGDTPPHVLCERYEIDAARLASILRRTNTKKFSKGFWLRRADDAERTQKVAELYLAGEKTADIAQQVGLPGQEHVYVYLRRAGIKPQRRAAIPASYDTHGILAAYVAGEARAAIAKRFGVPARIVDETAAQAGVLRTPEQANAIRIAAVIAANHRRAAA